MAAKGGSAGIQQQLLITTLDGVLFERHQEDPSSPPPIAFSDRIQKTFSWAHSKGFTIGVLSDLPNLDENTLRKNYFNVLKIGELVNTVHLLDHKIGVLEGATELMKKMKGEPGNSFLLTAKIATPLPQSPRIIRIVDQRDLSEDFLQAALEEAKKGKGDIRDSLTNTLTPSLNLVIPMAGQGSRFADVGFIHPKPFILVRGQEMWKLVVENLLPSRPDLRAKVKVHILTRIEHIERMKASPIEGVELEVHPVLKLTEGAACTVLLAKSFINNDIPLLIANCDQYLEWDTDAFYDACLHPHYDGVISTFNNPFPTDLRWSYANIDNEGKITKVAEKEYLGPDATTGIYFWKKGNEYVHYAEKMIAANERVKNEFYVCPVYNWAIKEGKRIRAVRCDAFWGTGVPVDFDTFVDQFSKPLLKPQSTAQEYYNELAWKYSGSNCRWTARHPAVFNQSYTDVLCAAVWSYGEFGFYPEFYHLLSRLRPFVKDSAVLYALKDSPEGKTSKAILHHTLFQFCTFPVTRNEAMDSAFSKWAEVINESLKAIQIPYYLDLNGIFATTNGIAIKGYPPTSYATVRDNIRKVHPELQKEPHKQDLHHITLLRWGRKLTPKELEVVHALLNDFADTPLGTFHPDKWQLGYASWGMQEADCITVKTVQAVPAPWILHRGLLAGPDKKLENDPKLLAKRLDEGWDVELDLWIEKGEAWLGHDEPQYQLTNDHIDKLLKRKGVWIHCKNIAAFDFLRSQKHNYHYFCHDVDFLALTSRGFAWAYPGKSLMKKSTVAVMPERHLNENFVINHTAVCSDYPPSYFKQFN